MSCTTSEPSWRIADACQRRGVDDCGSISLAEPRSVFDRAVLPTSSTSHLAEADGRR